MAFIEITGKVHLYVTDKLGKAAQLPPEIRHIIHWKCIIFTIKALTAFHHSSITEIIVRQHFHQQVKMVAHQTKTQYFSEVQSGQSLDYVH
jgi:hypothetical protein